MITIVTGFARCGSSLTMQMLEAAGMETTGRYPSFEPEETNPLTFDPEWLRRQDGKAVKVLEPLYPGVVFLPGEYRFIFVSRNPRQQAVSQAKFLKLMTGKEYTRRGLKKLQKAFASDHPKVMYELSKFGRVINITFEDLIKRTEQTTEFLKVWLGLKSVSIEHMAAVVLDRGPLALPGLDVELYLMKKREREERNACAKIGSK